MIGKLLNIPSTVDDPHYRYKMPRLELKIEGRGNGIKTNLLNLYDVSKYLRVTCDYPLKYLGYELGTQTTYKPGKGDATTIINGSFTEPELRKALDKFILTYICCPKCKYPEMRMSVKSEKVYGQCSACGEKSALDMVHKFAGYIVKNPPQDQSEFKAKKGEAEATTKTTKDPKEKPAKETSKEEEKEKSTKTEEQKEPKEPALVLDDLSLTSPVLKEMINRIRNVREKFFGTVENFDKNDEAVGKLYRAIKKFKLPEDKLDRIPHIIFFSLFDVNISKQISKYEYLLMGVLVTSKVKNIELSMLACLEHFFMVEMNESCLKFIPTILKLFNDAEFLSEEFLIRWSEGKETDNLKTIFSFNAEHDKTFLTHASTFVDWLKAAAEEEEEEEGEEEAGEDKPKAE